MALSPPAKAAGAVPGAPLRETFGAHPRSIERFRGDGSDAERKGLLRGMEIALGKSSKACYGCGKPFEHRERQVSLLRTGDLDAEFIREDYCKPCWEELKAKESPEAIYSLWSRRFFDETAEKLQSQEDLNPLRSLFLASLAKEGRESKATAYLVGGLLHRQGLFRIRSQRRGTGDIVRIVNYRDQQTGDDFDVEEFRFSWQELAEASRSLKALLTPEPEATPEPEVKES